MSYKKCIILIFCLFTNTAFTLQIGDQAPNFDAKTTLGNLNFYEWSKNHWVILFSHPGDFTPVCTTELASAALLQPEFNKRNVKVIALSADSVEDHLEWIPDINRYKDMLNKESTILDAIDIFTDDTDVKFPIITDEKLQIANLYEMYHPNAFPNSGSLGSPLKETVRSVFIIDPNNKIQTILIYPKNIGRNFKEILRILDALQVSAKYDVSTPADWLPGDKVIISNEVQDEDIKDKYQTDDVDTFENYLKFIKQPGFFSGSERGKKRSRGEFK